MLPFTSPAYDVTVEQDVPYATAVGYWSHAPVGDKKATGKLLLHSGTPKPLTLEMDISTPEGDGTGKRPLLLMMHGGFIAPNLNFEHPDADSEGLNIVAHTLEGKVDTVLSNSFGFGGTNSALVLKRVKN